MARKKIARKKKAAVAAVPTGRNLSVVQLQRVGACEGSLQAFEAIFGEKARITRHTVEKLSDEQLMALGRVPGYWLLSDKGQDALWKARQRQRRRYPWNLGYTEMCRLHLTTLARLFLRYPRRFAA